MTRCRPSGMEMRELRINSLSIQSLQLAVARVSAYPLREAPMVSDIQGRIAIIWLAFMFLCVRAAAQEGHYGVGHERWHTDFYLKLNRNDGKGTCCNLVDCRPTQSRMVGDRRFPTTRSTTWSRRTVVLTSALPNK